MPTIQEDLAALQALRAQADRNQSETKECINRLRAAVALGESTGDWISDLAITWGYGTPIEMHIREIAAKLEAKVGQFVLRTTRRCCVGESTGDLVPPRVRDETWVHLAVLAPGQLQMRRSKTGLFPHWELVIPVTQSAGCYLRGEPSVHLDEAPELLLRQEEGFLYRHLGARDKREPFSSLASDETTTDLVIGDDEVAACTAIDDRFGRRTFFASDLLRLATALNDSMDRTPELKRLRGVGRVSELESFVRTLHRFQEPLVGKEWDKLRLALEWMERIGFGGDEHVLEAKRMLMEMVGTRSSVARFFSCRNKKNRTGYVRSPSVEIWKDCQTVFR